LPSALLVSAARAPHLPLRSRRLHALPDLELLAEMRTLGGLPVALWSDHELRAVTLPALRADLMLCETYRHQEEPPLPCTIIAFGGAEDREVGLDELLAWRRHTHQQFRFQMFPGDHFFIHRAWSEVAPQLAQ
jgi:surfactin synthase thioesterase subunit